MGQGFVSKEHVTTVEHPSYSPDLAPSDVYLFPKLKSALNDGAVMMLGMQ
jgi:hypothetical protein